MQALEEQFSIYRMQHLGWIGKLLYRDEREILDLFPDSDSATEVIKDLEALANTSGLQRKLTKFALRKLQTQPQKEELSVIEVCGGNCWLLRSLLLRAKSINLNLNAVGSDISNRYIETNEKAFEGMGIKWTAADATDLSYSDCQFDLALNCQALHHFSADKIVRMLSELKRAAKKVIIFDLRRTVYGPLFVKLLSPFYSKSFINDGIISHRRAYSIQEMKFLIKISGLPYRVEPFTPVGMIVESI